LRFNNRVGRFVPVNACASPLGHGMLKPSKPMTNKKVRSERERGPISELVRLIVQAHHGLESVSGCRQETAWEGYAEPPEFPPAPQLRVSEDTPERTSELDVHQVYEACQVDDQSYIADHEHKPSRVRGPKVAVAIFSLLLVGTAGVFGY